MSSYIWRPIALPQNKKSTQDSSNPSPVCHRVVRKIVRLGTKEIVITRFGTLMLIRLHNLISLFTLVSLVLRIWDFLSFKLFLKSIIL